MKNNYPIKYASMPIISRGEYDPIAYVTLKCYKVEKSEKYQQNGETRTRYEVVFPFKLHSGEWERVVPEFHLINGNCINSIIVSDVFDDYEEAEKATAIKNKKIVTENIALLPYSSNFKERIEEIRAEHQELVTKYKKIADRINSNTPDLKINAPKKEQSIILKNTDKIIVLDTSLYDFIRTRDNTNYSAYHLSVKDFQELKERIATKTESTEYKIDETEKLLENDSKSRRTKIYNYADPTNSPYSLKEARLTYTNTSDEEVKSDSLDTSSIKAYTMETYEDVIESYITTLATPVEEVEFNNRVYLKKIEG